MNKEVIPKVKKIINSAMVIAKEMDDREASPEHITLAMIKENNNKCIDTLEALGVDVNALYDSVYDYLNKSILSPRVVKSKKTKIPFSKLTQEIFNGVDEQCDLVGDYMIDTSHLMLSMLKVKTPTKKILFDMGVNYKSFKYMIKQMKEDIENITGDEDFMNGNENEGDFFYTTGTTFNFTATKDFTISEIETDLRLPDGSRPKLEPQSCVIYKITKPIQSVAPENQFQNQNRKIKKSR